MQQNFEQYADEIQDSLTPFAPLVPFETIKTRAFPISRLPGALGNMVKALSESTQTPPEMAGILSLGILSTAFQSRYNVEITPDWTEPLCLYVTAVAPPGERKSAVISALAKPLYEYEAEQRELDAAALEQNKTERAILEGQLQAARQAAIKEPSKSQHALDLAAELADFKELHELRLLVDDTTPEKLTELMEKQGGCLTVCSAEGGVFDAMQGRYDKSLNLDVYLKAHAGDPVIVDRIGRKSNYIQTPRLTMMLTIQPEILNGLMRNTTFRGRGLCGRFLFAICNSKVGHRDVSPPSIPYDVREEYRGFVRRALSGQYSGIIRLSEEADNLRCEYQSYVEGLLGNKWEAMRDWGGKLIGATVRIAALLHCAQIDGDPTQTEISVETMSSAVDIAEVLGAHAAMAYEIMGADPDIADAQYILKRIANVDKITRSELLRLCRGHFKKSADMEPALTILIDRGYLREVKTPVGYNNRQQSLYEVNPDM